MDKKQELKDAYDKHQKTMTDITELELKILKFKSSEDFKKYEGYTEEEKKANFPEQYEMYNKKEELILELDTNMDGVIKSAKEYNKELSKNINETQSKIEKNKRKINKVNKNIITLKSKIDELVSSEKYKNNEKDMQSELKHLEEELIKKTNLLKFLSHSVKEEKLELKKLKNAKEELTNVMKDEYSISLDELAKEEKEQENDNSDIKQKQLKRGKNKAKKQNKKVKTEKEQPEEDNKDKNKEDEIDKEQVDDDSEVQPKQPEEDNKDKNKEPEQNNNPKKVYNKEKANANNVMYVYPQEQNNTNPQENSEQQTEAPKDENKKRAK